jgi:hypothetical protein
MPAYHFRAACLAKSRSFLLNDREKIGPDVLGVDFD